MGLFSSLLKTANDNLNQRSYERHLRDNKSFSVNELQTKLYRNHLATRDEGGERLSTEEERAIKCILDERGAAYR